MAALLGYANDRAAAIALMRGWGQQMVATGHSPAQVHEQMRTALVAVLDEFRAQFDVPGTTYWHIPQTNAYFTRGPGEPLGLGPIVDNLAFKLARHEYLSRQDIHFGYEEDRL